ncbi:MAG: NAD(P)H-dependent glycerol-3-phosphate dehydrogenase [Opitutales bacterium]
MNFCVVGAGAWGTAIAVHLAKNGFSATLVPRRYEHALELSTARKNNDYLPGITFPDDLQVGCSLKPALMECDYVFFACPSHALRNTCRESALWDGSSWQLKGAIALCKGLEPESNLFAHEVMSQEMGDGMATGYLTGPSHAHDIAVGKPGAMSLGLNLEQGALNDLRDAISSSSLRIYSTNDLIGVALGSCLKNVYAIATGISDGLGFGDNARAALLTRSMNEMVSLGCRLGGRQETFFGLSGFGDLIGTCMGEWSRNRNFGLKVASGESPLAAKADQITVVEGYGAAKCFQEKCQDIDIEMPILNEIFHILYRGKQPAQALEDLMGRKLKEER